MKYPKQGSLLRYLLPEYLFLADPLHNAIKHGEDISGFLPYLACPVPIRADGGKRKKKQYDIQ